MASEGRNGGETAVALFARAGYARAEPAILQPTEPFLELSGEDIRRHLFVTQDGAGRDWCLRPEYTIPVAMECLARRGSGASVEPGAWCYAGPVFRMQAEAGELIQAGLESFGREDATAADAEVMALTLEAVRALGLEKPAIRMGDAALLSGLLDGLGIAAAARRRLMRAIARGDADPLASLAPPAAPESARHAGLVAALEGADPSAAKSFVEDVLSIAGISSVGGRSARDIAERFLSRAAEKDNAVADEARNLLAAALSVKGDPDAAAVVLRRLAKDASLDLEAVLDAFEERTGFLAARGVEVETIEFSTGFARNLDYYTGFVFELRHPGRSGGRAVAGGGRYDGLLQRLGSAGRVPAVGASIWLDRIAAPKNGEGRA